MKEKINYLKIDLLTSSAENCSPIDWIGFNTLNDVGTRNVGNANQ